MKFFLISISIILFCTNLFSIDIDFARNTGDIHFSGNFELQNIEYPILDNQKFSIVEIAECKKSGQPGYPQLPVYSKLIKLPDQGNFTINNFTFEQEEVTLELNPVPFGFEDGMRMNDDFLRNEDWYPKEQIVISDPIIMRGIRFAQVSIYPIQYNFSQSKIRIMKDVQIDLSVDYSININEISSENEKPAGSFAQVARTEIIGVEDCYADDTGLYLFICSDNAVEQIEYLAKWKNKLGHKTHIASISETGNTNTDVKDYIQNAYDNWDTPPEYVILVGDITGSYVVPTFYKPGYLTPTNETDHTYALLDGDDYFPDVFIGRISIQNSTQLLTVINKLVKYEKDPYLPTGWQKKALMCTYLLGDYTSSRETVMTVREKLLDFEYTVVDTFISPHQTGQSALINKINTGYSFLNYRGAGGPTYWWSGYNVMFDVNNINALNNGFMLPFVTSIVCGGGDFGAAQENAFGETWLNAGNPSLPKGGIGFIGPSEHDTKTPFNNAIDMGIYQGITQEGLFKGGEMLLRGKIELYNTYPNMHEWGLANNSDQFYFFVYNLLGDPGLAVWTDIPQNFEYQIVNNITTSSNHVEVQLENMEVMENFIVAITTQDSLLAVGITDENGNVLIPCSFENTEYNITASKYGFVPKTQILNITEADNVALVDYSFGSDLTPGAEVAIAAVLKNCAPTDAENIQITLTCDDEAIEITNTNFSLADLEPNASHTQEINITITNSWLNGHRAFMKLHLTSSLGDQEYLIPLDLSAPELSLNLFTTSSNDELIQGETVTVGIILCNNGSITSSDFDVELESLNEFVTVNSGNSFYSDIAPGETGSADQDFQLTVNESIDGQMAHFKLTLSSNENILQEIFFNYPIGSISETSPTHCAYGYLGIESQDEGYFTTPEYEWIEIATPAGGDGDRIYGSHIIGDGFSDNIALPFDFQYFGDTFDRITVCSNGYLSFSNSDFIFHRNRIIPSGIGPMGIIAPFWDNLYDGHLYAKFDPDEKTFIVEWYNFRNYTVPNDQSTFQVILYDPVHYPTESGDGVIKFQYQEIHNVDYLENYATIGIEKPDKTDGVLIAYDNINILTAHEISDNTAIIFSTSYSIFSNADSDEIPQAVSNLSNYPNPFNPSTTISFNLNKSGIVKLDIFNIKGQKIRTLIDYHLHAGVQKISWDGTDSHQKSVASGIYYYCLNTDNYRSTQKMLLIK